MINYYFLGIGGIGMSAIARYFKSKGHSVGGYDRFRSELCRTLEKEGIDIHYTDNVGLIEEKYSQKENTTVVYTPAIAPDNAELNYFKENNFKIVKRSEILGEITKQSKGLCIAGTHGKTTISTITAHIFKNSSLGCNAFMGGISLNYNSNILLSDSNFVVIEADEYDRSFHTLSPFMAVVSATDADHLDIYNSHNEYVEAFEKFTSLIEEGGALVYKKNIVLNGKLKKDVRGYSYSATEKADFYATNIVIDNEELSFDFVAPNGKITDVKLGVPILVNVENSVAAMALAWLNGIAPDEIKKAIGSYRGVKRRFEKHLQTPKIYIDDYAHHPEELERSIMSLKLLYPNKNILGVFQPHLYSRTKDFYNEFAKSLSLLDQVFLLEIYPAREQPIEGISSKLIFDHIYNQNKTLTTKESLLSDLKNREFDVLVTLGAGDIDNCIPEIKKFIQNNF